jgi:class 3 adenylate cyclase
MEGQVIRFPVERRRPSSQEPERRSHPSGSGALPAPDEAGDTSRACALLSVELRRLGGDEVSASVNADVGNAIVNRCVLAALEVLSRAKAVVELGGTEARPVIDALFEGVRSELDAARAALTIRDAVRRVQRRVENAVQVHAALAAGSVAETEDNVTVTLGAPDDVAARMRERAAPGQILVAEPVWSACRHDVIGEPYGTPMDVGLEQPVAVFELNDLRDPGRS